MVPTREAETHPLTFGQEQLLVMERISEPGAVVFPLRIPLSRGVSVPLIDRVLTRIVERHDALRMSVVPGEPAVQTPSASRCVEKLPEGADPEVFGALEPSETAGLLPLLYAVEENSGHPRVVVHLPHIFVDGWSAAIVTSEFCHGYEALQRGGRLSPARSGAESFGAYAERTRRSFNGELVERHMRFWCSELSDAESLVLPRTRNTWRPGARYGRFPALVFELAECSVDRIAAAAGALAGSTAAVLLAAFCGAVSEATGQRDLLVHTPLADRGSMQKRQLVGCLVNLAVLRVRLPGRPAVPDMIRSARQALARAARHQVGPFQLEGRHTGAGRLLNLSPKVTIAFNQDITSRVDPSLIQRSPAGEAADGERCAIWEASANCTSDLHLEVLPSPAGMPLRYRITYRPDLWAREDIENLGLDMSAWLERLIVFSVN